MKTPGRTALAVLALVATVATAVQAERTVTAEFSSISVELEFTQADASEVVNVQGSFPKGVNGIVHVGELLVPDNGDCTDVGQLTALLDIEDGQPTLLYDDATLFGQDTLMGRAVVFVDANGLTVACGNVGFHTVPLVQVADFGRYCQPGTDHCILGNIVLIQPQDENAAIETMKDTSETFVYTDLYYRATGAKPSPSHLWHIHEEPVDERTFACSSTEGHWDPFDVCDWLDNSTCAWPYPMRCSPETPLKCEVGDFAGKHGPLDIPLETERVRQRFVDVQLPLSGPNSVANRSIVIHAADESPARLACASLKDPQPEDERARTVTASLYAAAPGHNYTASLTVSQLGETLTMHGNISTFLARHNSSNGDLTVEVHELPVRQHTGVPNCSDVGPVFADGRGDVSADVAVDGDIVTITSTDLTLVGQQTIMGRALVVRAGNDVMCGNIGFNGETIVQVAEFGDDCASASDTSCVRGYIRVEQAVVAGEVIAGMAETSETVFVVDVYRADGANATQAHNWHVHEERVAAPEDCASTAGHFDPFSVCSWTGTACRAPYPQLCTPDTPLACEVGDQSKKLAPIDIPTASNRSRRIFVDVQAPLFGPYSVADRSLVIHKAEQQARRIACASLKDQQPPPVRTRNVTASVATSDDTSGFDVAFSQVGQTLSLTAAVPNELQGNVTYAAVHELPPDESDVDCWALGGVLHQGAGDLSDDVSLDDDGTLNATTNVLSLFGQETVMGRGLVLTIGDTTVCGAIGFHAPTIVQVAQFDHFCNGEGCIRGYIRLEQAMDVTETVRTTEDTSETTVIVDVFGSGANAILSRSHLWHIHEHPVNETSLDCGSAGGHFDPFDKCVWIPEESVCEDPYPERCHESAPFQCEVGDFAGKHGAIDVPRRQHRQRIMFVDIQLPLFGPASVANRSIVIHGEDYAPSRQACASLLPAGSVPDVTTTTTTTTTTTPTTTTTATPTTTTTATGTESPTSVPAGGNTTATAPGNVTTITTAAPGTATTPSPATNTTTTAKGGGTTAAAPTTKRADNNGSRSTLSGGEKAGLAVGIIVGLVVLVYAGVHLYRSKVQPYQGASRLESSEDEELRFALHSDA